MKSPFARVKVAVSKSETGMRVAVLSKTSDSRFVAMEYGSHLVTDMEFISLRCRCWCSGANKSICWEFIGLHTVMVRGGVHSTSCENKLTK